MKYLIFVIALTTSGCFESKADGAAGGRVKVQLNNLNYQCRQIAYEASCGLTLVDCYVGSEYFREIRCANNVFIR